MLTLKLKTWNTEPEVPLKTGKSRCTGGFSGPRRTVMVSLLDPMPEFIKTRKLMLEVMNAPAHHKYHVVYCKRNTGWLFTGDLYVSRIQAVAFRDENISDAINSHMRILELDFDTILCGHTGMYRNWEEKLKVEVDFFWF